MKSFIRLFLKTLPFTIGVILILTSLAFLTDQYRYFEDERFWAFVFFAVIGIPTLLFGINKASNENFSQDHE